MQKPDMQYNRLALAAVLILLAVIAGLGGGCRAMLSKTDRPLMIPMPSQPWGEAQAIVGDGKSKFYSDFCMIKDKQGRWHCIGIGGEDGRDDTMFHAVAPSLLGPYTHLPKIASGIQPAPEHMWAPFAIWKDGQTANLYYCNLIINKECNERMLVAQGPGLETWTPYQGKELLRDNVVFEEPGDRDACIFWDGDVKAYLMYYATGGSWRGQPNVPVIAVRTSQDLMHWSAPVSVMAAPEGYQAAESPFVLKRNDYYYLWVSGFDYGRMSLYISRDPFNFGDPQANRIMEQSGHAPEIVREGGKDYMACAAIASKFDNKPAEHDLRAVYIQEMKWVESDDAARAKVTHKAGE